jgi:hypothetical protein
MTDNVYKFPKPKKPIPPNVKSPDQILSDLVDAIRQPRNNDLCHDMIDIIMIQLDAYGYDVKEIQQYQMKDIAFILEAVRSLVNRYDGEEHILQAAATRLFDMSETTVTLKPDVELITQNNDTP